MDGEIRLMQGNEACVEGALLAEVEFYAGYPISPSTEIAEILSRRLPERGGVFIQMEDEIASIAAVVGASLAGKKSMTATSGPGFSLMQENIGFACMTEIPCVVVNVMRGGPSTGLPTQLSQGDVMQARWGTHGDHPVIVLAPSSVPETLELVVTAFNFSEKYRVPVVFLMDALIGHMREPVRIPREDEIRLVTRKRPDIPMQAYQPYDVTDDLVPPIAEFGSGYRYHVTGLAHDQWGFPTTKLDEIHSLLTRLRDKIDRHKGDICLAEAYRCDDADIVVVSYGSMVRVAKSAVDQARDKRVRAGLFKLNTLWPFPADQLRRIAGGADRAIVPELNWGQLVGEVERVLADRVEVQSVVRYDGEPMLPDQILEELLALRR